MNGRGRATDNTYIERLWRSVKQEHIYLNAYENGQELYVGLKEYFDYYNNKRCHQSLDYKTPVESYKNLPEIVARLWKKIIDLQWKKKKLFRGKRERFPSSLKRKN